ncbi:hypothetical protein [Ancylobacter sp. IITR112]|uniref:hypothetical protein n=1 Tax=Ancylobacter sp. IITR112 TaxID=3138073 RepID=UPI00352B2166
MEADAGASAPTAGERLVSVCIIGSASGGAAIFIAAQHKYAHRTTRQLPHLHSSHATLGSLANLHEKREPAYREGRGSAAPAAQFRSAALSGWR